MILFKNPDHLRAFLKKKKSKELKTGLIPTMGALHQGHLSLLERSKKENELTICSIFVNPTQFNDPDDFYKYPVTTEEDIYLLEKNECNVLFMPSIMEIYPTGTTNLLNYKLGNLETVLEGKYRPGHFQGVCQVVHRLLEIIMPNNLYLGRKDYQQCMVINKLVELTGLNKSIHLIFCPTIRETDGLAMSSRNRRLNEEERKRAPAIPAALNFIKENIKQGSILTIKKEAISMLQKKGFEVDYIEIADAVSLQPIENWDGRQKIIALGAAFINSIRLIDNLIIN